MELREQIARAICGNWVVGDDRPWQGWLEEADAVLEVLVQQKPIVWGPRRAIENRWDSVTVRSEPANETDIPLYAAPGAQAAVPKGWQLVPTEPTSAMTTAFNTAAEALRQSHLLSGSYPASWQPFEAGYRAMLAVAPKHGEQE